MAIFGIINRRKGQRMRGGKIDRSLLQGESFEFSDRSNALCLHQLQQKTFTYVTSNESIIFSMMGKYVEYLVVAEEYEIV